MSRGGCISLHFSFIFLLSANTMQHSNNNQKKNAGRGGGFFFWNEGGVWREGKHNTEIMNNRKKNCHYLATSFFLPPPLPEPSLHTASYTHNRPTSPLPPPPETRKQRWTRYTLSKNIVLSPFFLHKKDGVRKRHSVFTQILSL